MSTVKKGSAESLQFGTADFTNLTVVTSVSAEMSYATEIFVKDNDGQTSGMVLADERGTATISGFADSAPSNSLGSESEDPSSTITGDLIIITGVRTNMSNEDFVTYEVTMTGFSGVTGGTSDKRCKHEISDLGSNVDERGFMGDLAYLVQDLKCS